MRLDFMTDLLFGYAVQTLFRLQGLYSFDKMGKILSYIGKNMERDVCGLFEDILLAFVWRYREKNTRNFRMAGIPAENETRYLPKTLWLEHKTMKRVEIIEIYITQYNAY